MASQKEIQLRRIDAWDLWKRGSSISRIAERLKISYKTAQIDIQEICHVLKGEVLSKTAQEHLTELVDRHRDRTARLWSNYALVEREYNEPSPNGKKISLFSKVSLQNAIIGLMQEEDESLRSSLKDAGILTSDNYTVVQGDLNIQNNQFNEWLADFKDRLKLAKEVKDEPTKIHDAGESADTHDIPGRDSDVHEDSIQLGNS